MLGDPLATRLVFLCLPTSCAGPFDPDPELTATADIRVIEIDRPGYGASDPLPQDVKPTVEQFADDIAEYFRSIKAMASENSGLQFGKAAAVGWSFGGAVATALAARHAELIDKLVVVASARPERMRKGERYSSIAELRKRGVERTRVSLENSLDDDGHPTLVTLGIDTGDPALEPLGVRGRVERMLDAGWAQRSSGMASDRLAVRETTWPDTTSSVVQDSLLIYGDDDALATKKDADWYAGKLHRRELIHSANSGHLVLLTEWRRVLEFVGDRKSH